MERHHSVVSFRVPSSAYTWSNETINGGFCTKRSGGVHQLVFLQLSYSGFCFGSCARPRDGSHHRIASTAHGYPLELYFQLWTAGGELNPYRRFRRPMLYPLSYLQNEFLSLLDNHDLGYTLHPIPRIVFKMNGLIFIVNAVHFAVVAVATLV